MDSIDRLGWAAGIAFSLYNVRVGVRANQPQALERILDTLPAGWRAERDPVVDRLYSIVIGQPTKLAHARPFHILYADAARVVRTPESSDAVFDAFESDLQPFLAQAAKDLLFVHAGVVGWEGKAILLPGRTYTGKSTLVEALVRAGATYYSDEFAVLDKQGRVHPYARPLTLRTGVGTPRRRLTPEELGVGSGAAPLPVGMVVVARYAAGAHWRPRRLTAGSVVLECLANTVTARSQPAEALERLRTIAAQAIAVKGRRGEAAETAAWILATMNGVDSRSPGSRGGSALAKREKEHA